MPPPAGQAAAHRDYPTAGSRHRPAVSDCDRAQYASKGEEGPGARRRKGRWPESLKSSTPTLCPFCRCLQGLPGLPHRRLEGELPLRLLRHCRRRRRRLLPPTDCAVPTPALRVQRAGRRQPGCMPRQSWDLSSKSASCFGRCQWTPSLTAARRCMRQPEVAM